MSLNDIVISGMSGRFPMSRNVDEFSKNLYSGVDMVTESDDRWPNNIFGMSNRMGRIPNFHLFDGNYFGIMGQMVEMLAPPARLIIESTHEAIIDAGLNPSSLRGTRTGVYIGVSNYPISEGYPETIQPDMKNQKAKEFWNVMGNFKSLLANRISFLFDFKGPSLITDTACCSSLTAFNLAMNDLLLGRIDYAVVGGIHMTLEPFLMHMQEEVGICSPRGISAVLDESADGFVKSDATAIVFLQRRSTAKRIYASVLSSRMNIDGKKRVGQFFPSSESQESLMIMTYKEAGIDPLRLTYIEGHLTGTKVGDPQEVKAIYNAYCALPGRKEPLPLGMLKSNIGHTEGGSGICSLIKVLLSYENEAIPPNINLKEIKFECREFCPPLYPNTEVLKYLPGMAAINNFGIGGVNNHVIFEPNYKLMSKDNLNIAEVIPRIVNICGRTEEAIRYMFDFIENNHDKVSRDFLALLIDVMKNVPTVNSAGFPFRGSIIIKKSNEDKYEYKKQFIEMKSKTVKPIWFLFPGLGGQWPAMAKALMPIKIFADMVEECHQVLTEFGFDLKHLLLSEDKTAISSMTGKFCATTCIELALFEILKALEITPDGIIGHSFGEIACAYADGCLTAKEAMIITYMRGVITESDKKIEKGLMAVCGLSKIEAKMMIPPEVVIACFNAKNTIVLSGPQKQMKELINNLKKRNIFVVELESSEIPYHSHYLKTSIEPMIDSIKKYLPFPVKRSKKWVSTALLDDLPKEEELKYASAEYFAFNLINPVFFYDRLKALPSDAIIIEIGPHSVFRKIITLTLESVSYISLMKKDSNDTNLDNIFSAIATLYELGVNPSIENLYPKVEFPVSRGTPSIGSLMKWDHSYNYRVRKYPDYFNRATASDMNIEFNLMIIEDKFYSGHCIDGNIIFPATGYLMLAWRQFAHYLGRSWNHIPVLFENVQFKRAVFMSEENVTKLKVRYNPNLGDFTILENDNLCATGKISSPSEDLLLIQSVIHEKQNKVFEDELSLNSEDIYKELRVMGYDYSGEFQRLKKIRTKDFQEIHGICEWNGNVITFLDALLQSMAFAAPFRKLMVPVMIKSIRIDPKILFETINHNRKIMKQEIVKNDQFVDDITGDMKTYESTAEEWKPTFIEANKVVEQQIARMKRNFCLFEANMPFLFNPKTKLLITHGIEVENVMTFPIPRKQETKNLVLDSYEFIANDDSNAIEPYDKKHIIEYLEVCKSLIATLRQIGFKELKCDFNYQNLSLELLENYRNQNNEQHIMFKVLDKLYKAMTDENKNIINLTANKTKIIFKELQNSKEIDFEKDLVNSVSKNERLIRTLTDIVSENYVPKKELKVTEINLSSELFVEEVEQNLTNFQILPTHINYELFVKSKEGIPKTFAEKANVWNPNEELKIKSSDLIIFRDSQELWNSNLDDLIKAFKQSVVSNGFLLTVCKYRMTEPEVVLKSGQQNTTINNSDLETRFLQILKTTKNFGFSLIGSKCDSIGTTAQLFRKIEEKKNIPNNNQVIEVTGDRSEMWFQMVQDKLMSAKHSDNKIEDVWLIARDTNINGIIGFINCLRLEPGGEVFKCIFDFDNNMKSPVDWNSKPFSDILHNDLVINVIKDGKLGTYRHLKLPKDYDKVVSNDYFLNITHTRDLASLQWFDARSIVPNNECFDVHGVRITQVPIAIYYSGLTFHDVMLATGRIPSGPQLLFTDCLIGCEFAGRRADTGERVMGFEMTRCFASGINANVNLISHIPEHWSMDDAITILTTYSTAWYGLIDRAGLKKGESILIHSGAGGVGQSAINICKHYNCDIYVTVGTEEKKSFLMKEYNIPENKIFSSRDIQFKYKIKELTKGKGVDIVLNSLAGEKLDAGYECLANGGRFVELGKFDLAQNKQLGMFDFLRDISFIGVAVDMCLMEKQDFAIRFFDWMHKNCNNGCVKPFNKIVFNANEAEKAFRYMTTGKHIGKIVIRIREEENNRKQMNCIQPPKEMITTGKTYFDPNKVYIITGGLGGFGLELVHWMVYMGARKFVLTSRSGLKNDYQKYVINRLKNFGEEYKYFKVNIVVLTQDCLTDESTRRVLSDASQLGQIGGIFHLSIVLNDCLLEKLSFDKFCESIDTKHKVFNFLDIESRKLSYNLDFFVVFSSVTCGKGNNGQTNYSFGNSLCEKICEQRRKDGLHGLAIQYGPVGDVGVFEGTDNLLQMSTLQKQRINSCCDILDKLLSVKQPIVTSYVKAELSVESGSRQKRLIKELWKALGIDPQTTPDYLTLGEIGIESMFAVDLQQELEREFNITIGLNYIKLITVRMLRDYEEGSLHDVQQFINDLKQSRDMIIRYKFVFSNETHSLLNNVKTGKPVYIMPPFEVTFSPHEELANKINRPVIGLNWTRDMHKLITLKDIANYYTELMKKLEPNGKFDCIGYLDGAYAISKMIKKGMVNKAVIVDVDDEGYKEEVLTDDIILELFCEYLAQKMPESFRSKLSREMSTETEIDGKIKKIVTEVKEFCGRGLIATDMEEIFILAVKRIHLVYDYAIKRMKKLNKLKESLGKKWVKKTVKLIVVDPFKAIASEGVDKPVDPHLDLYSLPHEMKDVLTIEGEDIDRPFVFAITTDLIRSMADQIADKLNERK